MGKCNYCTYSVLESSHYLDDRIREDWQKGKNTESICYQGHGEDYISKKITSDDYYQKVKVKISISDCKNGKIIEFDHGYEGWIKARKNQKAREEEEARTKAKQDAERKAREKKSVHLKKIKQNSSRLKQLEDKLRKWEEEKGLPSSLWTDVSADIREKMEIPESVNVPQVYILEFEDVGEYYVGMTTVGYPWRCYQHGNNFGPSCKYKKIKYKDSNYKRSIVTSIMDLVNPIDKKFECSHWIEFWLQQQMSEMGFIINKGKEDSPFNGLMGRTCDICKKICTRIRDEFNDNVFDEFLN
ncbi:MAG: hypothetical protein ACJZ49_07350 [Candidatus Thalassarchaeaceae archaeon]